MVKTENNIDVFMLDTYLSAAWVTSPKDMFPVETRNCTSRNKERSMFHPQKRIHKSRNAMKQFGFEVDNECMA